MHSGVRCYLLYFQSIWIPGGQRDRRQPPSGGPMSGAALPQRTSVGPGSCANRRLVEKDIPAINPVHPRSGKRNRAEFSIRFKSAACRLGPEFGPNERRKGSILSTGVPCIPLKAKALRVSIVGC